LPVTLSTSNDRFGAKAALFQANVIRVLQVLSPFTDKQATAFSTENAEIFLGFPPKEYGHVALLPEASGATPARDFA
jgi:hypothetical protein